MLFISSCTATYYMTFGKPRSVTNELEKLGWEYKTTTDSTLEYTLNTWLCSAYIDQNNNISKLEYRMPIEDGIGFYEFLYNTMPCKDNECYFSDRIFYFEYLDGTCIVRVIPKQND